MKKRPFVTKEQIEEIVKTYPTPFHIYDEKGIRENARRVKAVSYTHLTLPTNTCSCRSRWSPYH